MTERDAGSDLGRLESQGHAERFAIGLEAEILSKATDRQLAEEVERIVRRSLRELDELADRTNRRLNDAVPEVEWTPVTREALLPLFARALKKEKA